jgi:peptide/nickel transport system substrate-binding protein
MRTVRRTVALSCSCLVAIAVGISAAGCGGSHARKEQTANANGPVAVPSSPRSTAGGTLRIGMPTDPGLDPATNDYLYEPFWAYLTRTLMTYPLKPTAAGGGKVVPDLAEGEPKVSDDYKVWTFKLKKGIKYAPPFESRDVTANDIKAAIERIADPKVASAFTPYFAPIEGFSEAQKTHGQKGLQGIVIPDPYTITFKLTKPTPTFDESLALPAAAPAPAEAFRGHEKDYGRFLVASGPYMVAGADRINFTQPTDKQHPASGYVPNQSLKLVRNPMWSRETDAVRGANPDEIGFEYGGTAQTLSDKVSAGDLDVLLATPAPPQVVQRYRTNPELHNQLHVNPKLSVGVLPLNLAQPPFDDVHVRKAANLILNRAGLLRVQGGTATGTPASHFFVPTLVAGGTAGITPYLSANDAQALQRARAEMKQSKYDPGKTGRCTDPVCNDVEFVPGDDSDPGNQIVQDSLAEIGLHLKLRSYSADTAYAKCSDPKERIAICSGYSFGANAPDPSEIAPYILTSGLGPSGCCDIALLGATRAQLNSWGYPATVAPPPSLDSDIQKCAVLAGTDRQNCYVALDRKVSEEVVPFVFTVFPNQVEIVSSRVRNYTFDQFGYISLNYAAVSP